MALDPNGGCTVPTEIWTDMPTKQAIERDIERLIVGHFRTQPAARQALDIFTDPGTGGPDAVIDWLARNSFGRVINRAQMKRGYGQALYSVPDIITNRTTLAKSEFYEIKPDSIDGRRDGNMTVIRFIRLNSDFNLLFFPGEDYDPHESLPLNVPLSIGAVDYELTLKWHRHNLGLIVYEICYRRRQKQELRFPAPELFFLALLALLLFLAFRGMRGMRGMPGSSPITA